MILNKLSSNEVQSITTPFFVTADFDYSRVDHTKILTYAPHTPTKF